jgi:hypothetical protein
VKELKQEENWKESKKREGEAQRIKEVRKK